MIPFLATDDNVSNLKGRSVLGKVTQHRVWVASAELPNNIAFHARPLIRKPALLLGLNYDLLSGENFFLLIFKLLVKPTPVLLLTPKIKEKKRENLKDLLQSHRAVSEILCLKPPTYRWFNFP